MNLTLIADYGPADLAAIEVKTKLRKLFEGSDIEYLSVNPFNTIEAGFVLFQLVANNYNSAVYYVNVAPRRDDLTSREKNDGEKLVVGWYNGNIIFAVNSGFTLSYLKDENIKFYEVECSSCGSQFRSRDIFPEYIKKIMEQTIWNEQDLSKLDYIGKEVTDIPDMPEDKILLIDGYGNIKINNVLTEEQKNAEKLHVRIQGEALSVYNKDGIFAVPDGEMVIARGSSGCGDRRFLEISLRGGNAAKRFGDILPGTKVNIDLI